MLSQPRRDPGDQGISTYLGLHVIASAECLESPQKRLWHPHRALVPFADESAWFVAGAIDSLLGHLGSYQRDLVATILIDPVGPVRTLADLRGRRKDNQTSPMRFAAATPSAVLAVSCILFSLRGPALTLACPVEEAVHTVAAVATQWMRENAADAVIVASCPSLTSARSVAFRLSSDHGTRLDVEYVAGFLSGKSGTVA